VETHGVWECDGSAELDFDRLEDEADALCIESLLHGFGSAELVRERGDPDHATRLEEADWCQCAGYGQVCVTVDGNRTDRSEHCLRV